MKPPKTRKIRLRRELLILFLALGAIALLLRFPERPKPRVTISGLSLDMSVSEVEETLGAPDFRSRAYGAYIMEYWERKERPQLLVWSQDEVVYKIEGGTPEVDGKKMDASELKQVVRLLGTPQNGGRGGEVSGSGHGFLSYPEHRLLVQRDEATKFILFKSGKTD